MRQGAAAAGSDGDPSSIELAPIISLPGTAGQATTASRSSDVGITIIDSSSSRDDLPARSGPTEHRQPLEGRVAPLRQLHHYEERHRKNHQRQQQPDQDGAAIAEEEAVLDDSISVSGATETEVPRQQPPAAAEQVAVRLTDDEVRAQMSAVSRPVLKLSRSESDWRAWRQQPRRGQLVQFAGSGVGTGSETSQRNSDASSNRGAPEERYEYTTAVAPLHLTDTERSMVDDLPQQPTAAASGGEGASLGGATGAHASSSEESDAMATAMKRVTQDCSVNAITLTFTDVAVEKEYVEFIITRHGYIAAKIYTLFAGIIAVGLLFPYFSFEFTSEKWAQTTSIILYCGVSIGWLMLGLMFVKTVMPWRETIFFIAVATHWPAFATATILSKEDNAYRYAYTTLCFYFCCFIAQPRFIGMFFFLTLTPIATLFAATFSTAHYWDDHNRYEMLYWLMPIFPLFMLRVFERRSREAFVENRRGEAALAVLAQRDVLTRRTIARFFPLTSTKRLLETRGLEVRALYPATAMIATSVAGFTEWASQTSAEMVVSQVGGMFTAFDKLARRYGVERITSLGDEYISAVFPRAIVPLSAAAEKSVNRPSSTSSRLSTTDSVSSSSGNSGPLSFKNVASRVRQSHAHTSTSGTSNASRTSGSSAEADAGERCHRLLRFATAIRHGRDVLPLRIGVHVGSAVGGFVGIKPPRFDFFGADVDRVRQLERKGRKRRIHASDEIVKSAVDFGHPSADFDASDMGGQIFSSWRVRRAVNKTPPNPLRPTSPAQDGQNATGTPELLKSLDSPGSPGGAVVTPPYAVVRSPQPQVPATQPEPRLVERLGDVEDADVEEQALTLCAYLQRFGELQRERASAGYDSRTRLLQATERLAASIDQEQAELMREMDALVAPAEDDSPSVSGSPVIRDFPNEGLPVSAVAVPGANMSSSVSHSGGRMLAVAPATGGGPEDEYDGLLDNESVDMHIQKPGEELNLYRLNLWQMVFEDNKAEQQYRAQIQASGLSREVFLIFALSTTYLYCAASANTCGEGGYTRLMAVIIGTCLLLHIAFLHFVSATIASRFTMVSVIATYSAMAWASAMLYRPQCDEQEQQYLDNDASEGQAIALYFNQLAIAPMFAMEVALRTRMFLLVANSLQFIVAVAVRRATVRDEVLIWDALAIAFVVAYFAVSLFTDLAMRSGFQATMRRRALESNRSAHAAKTSAALELMLPSFVVDRFLRAAQHGRVAWDRLSTIGDDTDTVSSGSSGESRLTEKSTGSATGSLASALSIGKRRVGRSDAAHAMLTGQAETLWPYPRALLLVVTFEPPMVSYDVISDTITRIEAIARGRSLQKVKSIGTTVMFVAGIEKGTPFEDCTIHLVETALEIERKVFPPTAEGWQFRVGMHVGAVFGAVIGQNHGLSFDFFGDTVTTVRTVESTAPWNTIRLTAAMRQVLPPDDDPDIDWEAVAIAGPVTVKGKGGIQVYQLHSTRTRGAQVLARPAGRQPGGGNGGTGAAATGRRAEESPVSDNAPDPSVVAESIRSSLRSQNLLPLAAITLSASTANAAGLDSRSAIDDPTSLVQGASEVGGASRVTATSAVTDDNAASTLVPQIAAGADPTTTSADTTTKPMKWRSALDTPTSSNASQGGGAEGCARASSPGYNPRFRLPAGVGLDVDCAGFTDDDD